MTDLTVFCVCVCDKYDIGYVYALKAQVDTFLTVPHAFKCISDREIDGIETIKPVKDYDGWWSKINLFANGIATGKSIYLDLDVVITKNIDYLVEYTDTFSAPANWAQSGHGGIQSSVMCWPGNWHLPFEKFNYERHSKRLWGDQEFLWELLDNDWEKIPNIGSYKYHVRPVSQVPEWMHVCVFHGKPDPHEVKDECMLSFTKTLRSNIKSSMDNGSKKALKNTALT